MVKSTSCFKIITCGSDSKDKDDIEVSEAKGSSDKRGWSFRKRSARHRVLSNTVISETPSSANKESPEDVNINYQQPANSTVLEKISVIQSIDEKPQLSTSVETKVIETVVPTENENKLDLYKEESVIIVENKLDVYAEESVIIVIQAAIRGFLGQRMLLKLKNVVKLQAAVRGYLVRSHAVGTLRCVQAIAKMQALVRARRARLSLEGSYPENKLGGKHENDTDTSKTWEKEKLAMESNVTYTSIEKLLSNGFARQLLESTPKTKPIHVKCDPSKHDSAWKWLERWMSVSSPDIVESKKAEPITEKQAYNPTSLSEDDLDQPRPESINTSDAKETLLDMISLPNQSTQADSNSQVEFNFLPVKPETETEQPKRSMKRLASEQLDTEEKKCVFGSRKPSNPAFIAAQSKFEELSTITSAGKDAEVESNIDTTLSGASTVIRTKELGIAENSTPHSSRIQVGGSECGTELSISSTLDSPDISEVGAPECDHEAKVLEDGIYNPNSMKNMVVESKDESSVSISNLSPSVLDKPENLGDVNGESVNLMVTTDTPLIEPKPEKDASADLQRQLDSETGHQPYRTSPEASPRSHITMPESHGTPSSQVSVKSKKKRSDKSGSNQKPRSLSGGKKSPSNPNHDSGSRGSVEQLPREEKNGKRRNSFGSAKSDPIDQEPVESNTNSSLPHFMQATESARAKLQANNSPRSSPDVQDRDSYIKKRHSLPGANGRQGSPRILHSTSQAQQSAKGNVTYQHERKWQR
nr:protein IQ-DOMAIN 32 isoform X2 [Quercus suber]POF20643.1 protein iq-domain 32 [Quercus suber]